MAFELNHDISRRTLLRIAGASGVSLTLAHLFNPGLALAQTAQPKRGGKITHANCYYNNRAGESTNGRNARYLPTYNTRVFWNCLAWVNNDFGVEPELATSWEASDDFKTWDFKLREDVLFHDGTPMTSADAVASFEYHMTWATYAKLYVDKVEAVGPHGLRFTLKLGSSEFPWLMADYDNVIMPKKTPDEYKADTSAIGTGPFRLIESDNRRSMRGERFEQYWEAGMPFIDEYEMVLTDSQASLNGFRTGQFNVVTDFDPALADQYIGADGVLTEVAGYQCGIQLDKTPGAVFADKRIRQALALAINRDELNTLVYRKPGGPTANDTYISTADPYYLPHPPRDVAKAKALLAEAGHPNGIKLPTLYYGAYYPELGRAFSLISRSLAEAGIEMAIEERPTDGFSAWATDPQTNPGRLHSPGPSGNRHASALLSRFNRGQTKIDGWEGPGYDKFVELYNAVVVTDQPDERRRLYAEIQNLIFDEQPMLVPIARRNMLVHKAGINGLGAHIQHWSQRWQYASID